MASTANLVNCTTPYDCALLSRYHCLNTPGTCSSCYIGLKGTHCLFFILLLFLMPFIIFYHLFLVCNTVAQFRKCATQIDYFFTVVGAIGDSNTKCYNTSTIKAPDDDGAVGTRCDKDTNCRYGYCKGGICAAPLLTCPTSITGRSLLCH